MENIKIGVVPVKRAFLSLDNAKAQAVKIMDKLHEIKPEQVELIGIDDVVESGVLWDDYDNLEKVTKKMHEACPDALFMPHCDFGTEEVVGKLGKAANVPFLLWGPRDEAPKPGQPRAADTQCGVFASSRALQRYGVPFSYIVNSALDSGRFVNGFQKFASTASVVSRFRKMKITKVSMRPRQFMSVTYNEDQLMSKFGMEVIPVSAAQIMRIMKDFRENKKAEIQDTISDFQSRMDCQKNTQEQLENLASLKLALLQVVHDTGSDCVALECWSLFGIEMGFVPCVIAGDLSGMGIPVSCETDVLGAISSALLDAASFGQKATFFADLTIRHPENDNAELLWHCGPFPYVLKHKDSNASMYMGKGSWKLQDGNITLTRFDAMNGEYRLFSGEGKTCDGPETTDTYVWFETDCWERWEEVLINGPYIHHVSGIYGNYSEVLNEACKYMPGVASDSMNQHGLSL